MSIADTITISNVFVDEGANLGKTLFNEIDTGTVTVINPVIYPEWWGVSGTFDDVPIQKAFDCAVASGGSTVEFGSRTYNTRAEIVLASEVDNLRIVGNGTIISGGIGVGAVVKFGDGAAALENLTVEGIEFTTSVARTSVIEFSFCPTMKMQNCRVRGTATYGVYLEGGNWIGVIDSCQIRGNFDYCIYSVTDGVFAYKNNGFTVQNSWIHGQNKVGAIAGLYINDTCTRFRSMNNYYEKVSATGSYGIYNNLGYKFLSFGDTFEGQDSVAVSVANHARFEHLNFGSSLVN
jgi:hypothetical protein